MNKSHKKFEDEVNKFFSSLPPSAFEPAECPLCNTGNHSMLMFRKKTMEVRHCACGFVYNARQAKQEYLDKFYSKSKAMSIWADLKKSPEAFYSQRDKFEWVVNHITNNGIQTVLDIGCGTGVFLSLLKLEGTDVRARGIDQNKDAVEAARRQGLDVTCASIHDLRTDEKFDAVTLWGVLEHVKNPRDLLWKAKSLLTPKGVVIVCVPNYLSTVFQHLRKACYSYTPPHLWYFCFETLETMFDRCGLDLQTFTTIESEVVPITKHMLGFPAYADVPKEHMSAHFDEREVQELENYILSLYQGYKIIAIGRQTQCTMQ